MYISTRGRYGLRALIDLTAHYRGKPVPLTDIARREGISEGYLEQLMTCLKKAGFVRSIRGVQGGYILAKPAEQIDVLQILLALEGSLVPASCVGENKEPVCARQSVCTARLVWQKVKEAVDEVLSSYTLADLLPEEAWQENA